MHNNYYFLKHLVPALHSRLEGSKVTSCFSQNKNELILRFDNLFIIKALLDSSFCCLSFPAEFHRARKNSVDLFEATIGLEVIAIKLYRNERCFSIDFADGNQFLFKMHGNRSNILLIRNRKILGIFNNSLRKDITLEVDKLDRPLDQSFTNFQKNEGEYSPLFPTFGLVVKKHLKNIRYHEHDLGGRWQIIEKILAELDQNKFYLTMLDDKVHLSVIRSGPILQTFDDPITALNAFFNHKIKIESFEKEKARTLKQITQEISKANNYIRLNEDRLRKLRGATNYSQKADVLMANLHHLSSGIAQITLPNFYDGNKPVDIKLKKELSPQKNAEHYYRKAKNQHKEVQTLEANIQRKIDLLDEFNEQLQQVNEAENLKKLRSLGLEKPNAHQQKEVKPFMEREYMNYQIWIGKNAKANDTLLRNYTHKDDLWLHAKDVAGSHVIVKAKRGQTTPESIIEKAAGWAAFYSKRKNDSLCPVIYTPRKFVRKRKGDPPGAVVVDKEKVVLVVPAKD